MRSGEKLSYQRVRREGSGGKGQGQDLGSCTRAESH